MPVIVIPGGHDGITVAALKLATIPRSDNVLSVYFSRQSPNGASIIGWGGTKNVSCVNLTRL